MTFLRIDSTPYYHDKGKRISSARLKAFKSASFQRLRSSHPEPSWGFQRRGR